MQKKQPYLLFVLFTATLLSACGNDSPASQQRDTVSVQGQGSVKGQPDTFILNAVASQRGDDVSAMKSTVDSQVQKLLQLADQIGIDKKHITASEIRIAPHWQYQPERKLLGYEVSRDVTFRVEGMARYAKLADDVTDAGITQLRPGGSSISNARELNDEALKKAVVDARAKAKLLAETADRHLGDAITITSNNGPVAGPRPMRMMAAAKQDASSSYRPGEQDITATVNITFELE